MKLMGRKRQYILCCLSGNDIDYEQYGNLSKSYLQNQKRNVNWGNLLDRTVPSGPFYRCDLIKDFP